MLGLRIVLVGQLLLFVKPYVIGLFGSLEPDYLEQFVQSFGKAHPYCICGFHAANLTLSQKSMHRDIRLEPFWPQYCGF